MPIDVKTADSPGWWMLRLSKTLHDTTRQARLAKLQCWHEGDPPLPEGATNARSAFQAFQRDARSNFAGLIGEALTDRMKQRGMRTPKDSDDTGDADAWRVWRSMRGPFMASEVHRIMGKFGLAYAIVGEPVEGIPVLTAEDPRYVVHEPDPIRPWMPRAGLKMLRDDVLGLDLTYLFRPGKIDVAVRKTSGSRAKVARFDATTWDLDPGRSGPIVVNGTPSPTLMPLIAFPNLDEKGEFEPHLDLLSRINRMILQRMMIATLQAFRQRGVKGLPSKDDQGNPINWNDILSADPAALWALPATAEIWESQQVDLRPILDAIRADVAHLAAVSRTPMPMLDPGGENQAAASANQADDGLVFKAEDRIDRTDPAWSLTAATAFQWLGDTQRAKAGEIAFMWRSPRRTTLADRSASAAQAAAAGVPWRTRMTDVMEYDPDKVDRMEAERLDDLLLQQRFAAAKASQQGGPETAAPAEAASSSSSGAPAPSGSGSSDGQAPRQGSDSGSGASSSSRSGSGPAAGRAAAQKQGNAAGGQ